MDPKVDKVAAKENSAQVIQPFRPAAQTQETVQLIEQSEKDTPPAPKASEAPVKVAPIQANIDKSVQVKPEAPDAAAPAAAAEASRPAETSSVEELPALVVEEPSAVVEVSLAQVTESAEAAFQPIEQVQVAHEKDPVLAPAGQMEGSQVTISEVPRSRTDEVSEPQNTTERLDFQDASESSEVQPDPSYELAVSIEEVEQTLDEIAEKAAELEPEAQDKVYELLEEIASRIEKSRSELPDDEQAEGLDKTAEVTTETVDHEKVDLELKEQVKELFTELLDELEIEHTPELVDALAEVAMRGELQLAKPEEELTEQLDVVAEPAEALQPIAERFQELEEDEKETTLEMLTAVSEKVEEFEQKTQADTEISKEQVSLIREGTAEEIKESVIELLDYLEIEYSPELVDELVEMAFAGKIEELVAFLEQAEPIANHDRGTHEVLQQLVASVSKMKKALLHAYEIGKSTLQLYMRELAAAKAV